MNGVGLKTTIGGDREDSKERSRLEAQGAPGRDRDALKWFR